MEKFSSYTKNKNTHGPLRVVYEIYEKRKDPYRELAIGIIKNAAEDYERAICGLREYGTTTTPDITISRCETFFKSDYFKILSHNADGNYILDKIKRDAASVNYKYSDLRKMYNVNANYGEEEDYE